MNKYIYVGRVDDKDVRIRQVRKDDCVVEIHVKHSDKWCAVDEDDFCATVYMTAYLAFRVAIKQVMESWDL